MQMPGQATQPRLRLEPRITAGARAGLRSGSRSGTAAGPRFDIGPNTFAAPCSDISSNTRTPSGTGRTDDG